MMHLSDTEVIQKALDESEKWRILALELMAELEMTSYEMLERMKRNGIINGDDS